MNSLIATILVCSLQGECNKDTAIDIIVGQRSNTPIKCLMDAELLLANSKAIISDNERTVIYCNRAYHQ